MQDSCDNCGGRTNGEMLCIDCREKAKEARAERIIEGEKEEEGGRLF